MGMFDHIVGVCPACGDGLYGQTKGGDCCLNTYTIEPMMDAPDAMAVDGEILDCRGCKREFCVEASHIEKVAVRLRERK